MGGYAVQFRFGLWEVIWSQLVFAYGSVKGSYLGSAHWGVTWHYLAFAYGGLYGTI